MHGMQEVSGSIPLSSTRIWEASEKKLPRREKACYDNRLSSARQKTRCKTSFCPLRLEA
ncbi:hypothetical protein CNECB9_5140010 [Cupriavidus necator]|uniref:Uncharacterized protein n=1 Tax=Cupriavidus necator TaxID=106590 RepID=A0A1K0JIP9_CUPNE|nr:hypothetical protein CNECB9_5140010 [Cupriavidus necator]